VHQYEEWIDMHVHDALRAKGFGGVMAPVASAFARSLGLSLRRDPPQQTDGWYNRERLTLHVKRCADRREEYAHTAHETTHHIAYDNAMPEPHDDDLIEHGAACVQVPRWGAQKAVGIVGLDPYALLALFPEVPPARVFLRVAMCTESVAIVRVAGQPEQVARCLHHEVNTDLPTKAYLFREVRRTRRPACDPFGIWAYPFRDLNNARGTVILADVHRFEIAV
jgi:hypothetical protein